MHQNASPGIIHTQRVPELQQASMMREPHLFTKLQERIETLTATRWTLTLISFIQVLKKEPKETLHTNGKEKMHQETKFVKDTNKKRKDITI